MKLVPCMGGWCRRREACMHYVAPKSKWRKPSERLCPKGQDQPEPVKPAKEAA